MINKKCKILFQNGRVLEGKSLGYIGTTGGEVCFNTGMTGYQEILTDPSYKGQMVTMTYPHIGNYGVNHQDVESKKIQCSGFIVKQATEFPSNYRSTSSLDTYLEENKIVGIQNIDTRMITRMIRDEGAMNAVISSSDISDDNLRAALESLPDMNGLDLAKEVTCQQPYIYKDIVNQKYRIAALDYGVKENILRILSSLDCEVKVFPASSSSSEILDYNPDGIFLSNGPGDPEACTYAIQMVKELLGHKPIFGICLGHQILSLALGAQTFKMKFGHRGCNHPVKNLESNIIEITSQNHGFAVEEENLPKNIEVTHINLNDNTIEGIRCEQYNAFSVQHHPEASPGPHDSKYLFDNFIQLIQSKVYA
tara:strand:- start:10750 stop:11847 length:1098 start_codon:yes stop_codon:yes gene_type:complete